MTPGRAGAIMSVDHSIKPRDTRARRDPPLMPLHLGAPSPPVCCTTSTSAQLSPKTGIIFFHRSGTHPRSDRLSSCRIFKILKICLAYRVIFLPCHTCRARGRTRVARGGDFRRQARSSKLHAYIQ
ncbi:hypothetical protein RSAG8_02198, partial [Rhizoctonia solani AG-8 WAC10335]